MSQGNSSAEPSSGTAKPGRAATQVAATFPVRICGAKRPTG
eukprot:CAMPEP_0115400326 /NCGR_PEP_ID=MMETSP0271-20121206/15300_1 /TAXON_ID=71861 /ORGANISM="Scrippsiella trochoidea, Strain CCMP3099" /LENGTH=40 /DNA_ID= /DNA_START= /DNA_END= /DNA_ORIENTATION=